MYTSRETRTGRLVSTEPNFLEIPRVTPGQEIWFCFSGSRHGIAITGGRHYIVQESTVDGLKLHDVEQVLPWNYVNYLLLQKL